MDAQPWELKGIPENFIGGMDCSALNSAYPESKRIAETICSVYRNQQRLPIVNARPFAFIGPYQGLVIGLGQSIILFVIVC